MDTFQPIQLHELYNGLTPINSLIIGKRGCGKTSLSKEIIANLQFINKVYEMTSINSHQDIINNQKINCETPILLIFDDLNVGNGINKNAFFRDLLLNGRNYNISIIMILQFPINLKPELRTQFDVVYYYYDIVNNNLVHKQYFRTFPTLEEFNTCMQSLQKYECIVLTNKIGFYKAKEAYIVPYTGIILDDNRFNISSEDMEEQNTLFNTFINAI